MGGIRRPPAENSQSIDARAKHGQDRWEQADGTHGGDEHNGDPRIGERAQEVQGEDEQGRQAKSNGEGREKHGSSGARDASRQCLLDVVRSR